MSLRLKIYARAEQDIERLFTWIEQHSPQGAASWRAALKVALQKVLRDPAIYGLAPESVGIGRDLRQFLFKTRKGKIYRGLFLLAGEEIWILRIRGPGQPPLLPDELE